MSLKSNETKKKSELPELRVALAEDAEAITQLVNSAYRGESSRVGWTTEADLLGGQRTDPGKIREMMAEPGSVVLVGGLEGIQVCVSLSQKPQKRAYLGMLTVQPALQDRGWGGQLLARAEEWARKNWQTKIMEMTVITKRTELIEWYLRRGYSRTDRSEAFPYGDSRFGEPRVDDLEFIVLEKAL